MQDGIHEMIPYEKRTKGAQRYWDYQNGKPGAPFYQKEFGYYSLERWHEEGLAEDANLDEVFGFDPPGRVDLHGLGWCEAGFDPWFEEKLLEDRGEYELVQDMCGRAVLCFKGRKSGFMPEYLAGAARIRAGDGGAAEGGDASRAGSGGVGGMRRAARSPRRGPAAGRGDFQERMDGRPGRVGSDSAHGVRRKDDCRRRASRRNLPVRGLFPK